MRGNPAGWGWDMAMLRHGWLGLRLVPEADGGLETAFGGELAEVCAAGHDAAVGLADDPGEAVVTVAIFGRGGEFELEARDELLGVGDVVLERSPAGGGAHGVLEYRFFFPAVGEEFGSCAGVRFVPGADVVIDGAGEGFGVADVDGGRFELGETVLPAGGEFVLLGLGEAVVTEFNGGAGEDGDGYCGGRGGGGPFERGAGSGGGFAGGAVGGGGAHPLLQVGAGGEETVDGLRGGFDLGG